MHDLPAVQRKTIKVPLTQPVEWFSQLVREVTIKEPTASDFFAIGEPSVVVHSKAGTALMADVNDNIIEYIKRCVGIEQADLFLTRLPLKDGQAIKKGILSFFLDAPETTSG